MSIQKYYKILNTLPIWSGVKISVKRLYGGGTNDNFLVKVGKDKYVARFQGESQRKVLGLNRIREIYNAKVAHKLGIGAEVIAHYPNKGLLLVRYIEGRALQPKELRKKIMIRKIVNLLKRLHRGPNFKGKFSVIKSIEHFWKVARQDGKKSPWFGRTEAEKYKRCILILNKRKATFVPCHVDLVSINMISRGRILKIIDWDYSSMADPLFELAFISGWSSFNFEEDRLLLSLYFGFVDKKLEKEFYATKALVYLREAVWAHAQYKRSSVPFDYQSYLEKYIRQFRQAHL